MSERKRFYAEKLLSDLIALYQNTGLVVWGQIQGAPGTYQKLLVLSDGTVVVTGTTTISGTVDVSDRANRLLGIIYGDVGQLLQRSVTRDLLVQLRNAGSEIDPRSIRALAKATDELYSVLRTDAGVAYDARDRTWTITENLARSWLLTSADVVSAIKSGTWNIDNLLNPHPVSLASIPNPSNLDVLLSTRASETGGNLAAIKAKTDNLDVALSTRFKPADSIGNTGFNVNNLPSTYTIDDITKQIGIGHYLAPTALGVGGTATIWTPASGKAIRAKRIQVSVDAATRIDFRWTTTTFESYYLPANGSIIVNLVGANEQPAANATLTILSSAAANVTAKATGDEV